MLSETGSSAESAGLVVNGLRVEVAEDGSDIVSEVGFAVPKGTALGIVGESGCGKTTVAMALLGFARPGTMVTAGRVEVGDVDILSLRDAQLRSMRGRVISYVPQNPSRALSPGMRVKTQLEEMLTVHVGNRASQDELLDEAWAGAQLPADRSFLVRYPHQLSGGQQQRVAIAMALVCQPRVIVMDEPTTGLDVLTQKRLLDVIGGLRARRDSCIVYISHDLGVVRNLVDRVAVMYGGRLVEEGAVDDIFRDPQHPYTRRLLEAIPRVHRPTASLRGIPGHAVEPWNRPPGCPFAPRCDYRIERCDSEMPPATHERSRRTVRCWRAGDLEPPARVRAMPSPAPLQARADDAEPLLKVTELVAEYRQGRSLLGRRPASKPAVDGVSFELHPRRCLAIVGESGSGKTTLARVIAGLHAPSRGTVAFAGRELAALARGRSADVRRRIQIIFQDPDSSLNPSMSVGAIVRRPLTQFFDLGHRAEERQVRDLLERVHLSAGMASRLPRELSGGEKQRVAIARAIAAEPTLLVCDEVTSALDVAVQASILELLGELRAGTDMAMIFVSHDLAVVRTISDVVLVMSEGRVRELAAKDTLFTAPQDEYTKRLLGAAPDLRDGDYPWTDAARPPALLAQGPR